MDKKELEILEEINQSLKKVSTHLETEELFSESDKLISKAENRVENSLNQIQNTFDRIHDKVFNFNNVLIGVYLVLGTFPDKAPILNIWTAIFPILNLIFLVLIDIRQMEIHRFASREMEWTADEREEYGKRIRKQTNFSLLALITSIGCLVYLIIALINKG
jgi:hypothetical protein